MLHVIPEGDGVFRLTRAGRTVAWIRGASIRVGAFGTEREAMPAALLGHRVLGGYLSDGIARRAAHALATDTRVDCEPDTAHGATPMSTDRQRCRQPDRGAAPEESDDCVAGLELSLVHDGAYEWVVHQRRPIARLIRPASQDEALRSRASRSVARKPTTFALEFVAPPTAPPVLRVILARLLVRALDPTSPSEYAGGLRDERRLGRPATSASGGASGPSGTDEPPPRPAA
jgi:hypothetical protein